MSRPRADTPGNGPAPGGWHLAAGVGALLAGLSVMAAGAPVLATAAPPAAGSERRTQPLDFDYRLEGVTSLVLQIFDDGEAVHVQPAAGSPLALRAIPVAGRPRGPYLVLPGLPARFTLADNADPSRRVDITHRRRARAEEGRAPGEASATVGTIEALTPRPALRSASGLAGSRPASSGLEPESVAAASIRQSSVDLAHTGGVPEVSAGPVSVEGGSESFGADRCGNAPASGRPAWVATATEGCAPGEPLSPREPVVLPVPPGGGKDTLAPGRAVAPALEFAPRASVQTTLRRWLAEQGLRVEFIGVPPLRIEEAARVQRDDPREAVAEALGRLGLRGEWSGDRLRVMPPEATR